MATSERKLPALDSPEWKQEVKLYQSSTKEWRDERAKQLGFNNRGTYQSSMANNGIVLSTPETPEATQTETPVINLPPVTLKKYIPINKGRAGDPETQVLHLTDHHIGQITPSFNESVYDARLEHLFQSTMKIASLHRNLYPINDLRILITGDMVHGENVFQGAKVESIERGARSQIIVALLKLSEFILSLKQEFLTVEVDLVPGNHGRYSREAPKTSNWDLMLYDQLKLKLEPYGIKVNISNTFYKIVEIQGLRFFIFHGDQFKASQGVPWFALTKGLQSWYVTYSGFDYAVCGHFHRDDFLRLNAKAKLIMGASMVTDDPFTEEVIKTSSIPCQWTWGVNKDKGITWSYSLIVDPKYFPKA
jgi:hypothetical protein